MECNKERPVKNDTQIFVLTNLKAYAFAEMVKSLEEAIFVGIVAESLGTQF